GGNVTTGLGTLGVFGTVTGNQAATPSTIAGNLELGAGPAQTFAVAAGAELDVPAVVSSFGAGVQKTGAGTLVLSGNNTYVGATAVDGGVLNVRHASALGQ